jgi:sortase (surface protein transpeptidase)
VAPTRLRVPSVGIDAPLTGIGLDDDGLLTPPGDLATAGWYRQGPAPGRPGPAVIAGHVDGADRPAVFFRLREVTPGDTVLVTRADASVVRFTVTRVARYAKAAFPTADVYGPTQDAGLRLITCGGRFDRAKGSYRDNVVVYASVAP